MALGLLIVVVLIFALRGAFAGLSGVIGKLLGIALGYIAAWQYRAPLAVWVQQQTQLSLPKTVIEIGCGLLLFITTLFVVSKLIAALFTLLAKHIPFTRMLTDKEAVSGKIAGAMVNGSLAGIVFLLGLYVFGKFYSGADHSEPVQQLANRLGDSVYRLTSETSNLSFSSITNVMTQSQAVATNSQENSTSSTQSVKTLRGTATITSSDDPGKTLSIETFSEVIEEIQNSEPGAVQDLLNSDNMQAIIQNPKLRKTALEQLKNNPDQLQELLNNPQISDLINRLQPSGTQ